jgi:hypothetical protein
MAKKAFTVSGVVEVQGALVRFERDVLPAEMRKGTRAAAKKVLEKYKLNAGEHADSGAMRDAAAVRAMRRSRKRIGHSVVIRRLKLFALYLARRGRLPGRRKGESQPFFYPAVVELGDSRTTAEKPLRSALYGNTAAVKAEFARAMIAAINNRLVKATKVKP